jgi:hypothetical protein
LPLLSSRLHEERRRRKRMRRKRRRRRRLTRSRRNGKPHILMCVLYVVGPRVLFSFS